MINGFKVLALIPARGGSKGVPRKNVRPLAGLPLIAHSIRQAKRARYIDRVVVSTDNREIAQVSKRFGAEVPFIRPASLAKDRTPDLPVVHHCLAALDKTGFRADIVVFLRPTGPLRTVRQIEAGIRQLVRTRADSVRSVNLPPQTPYKMWVIKGKFMTPLLKLKGRPDAANAPRQSLPPVYQTNPHLSVLWRNTILKKRSMLGKKVSPLIVENPVVDIDELFDFVLAETMLRKNR